MRSTSALARTRRFNAVHRVAAAITSIEQVTHYLDTIGDTGIAAARLNRLGAIYQIVDNCHEVQWVKCLGASPSSLRAALEAWLRGARRELEMLEGRL